MVAGEEEGEREKQNKLGQVLGSNHDRHTNCKR